MDTLDALNEADESDDSEDDSSEEVEEKSEETTEEESEEKEEESEEEEEEEEGSEEKEAEEPEEPEELEEVRASALAKSLSEKYKGIFKENPALRGALFRDEQYRQIFPDIEEAKEAFDRSETLAYLEQSIGAGSPEPLLETLDEAALTRFAKAFVPGLAQKNPKIAHDAFLPVVNGVLRNAINTAQRLQNKNLGAAAQIISNFLNGTNNPPEFKEEAEDPAVKKKMTELEQREKSLLDRQQASFSAEIQSTGDKRLFTEIRKSFESDKLLTSIEKDALAERTFRHVMQRLSSDENHIRTMDSLWMRARKASYSKDWVPRILNGMLGAARSILPGVRAKVRAEALKTKKPIKAGIAVNPSAAGGSKVPVKVRKDDVKWDETSTLDFINGKVKLKSKN